MHYCAIQAGQLASNKRQTDRLDTQLYATTYNIIIVTLMVMHNH